MSLKDLQKEIVANKKRHNFNVTDMNEEFCHLYGEVAEAHDAWYKGMETFPEELADVAIFLLGIAELNGIDLEKEIERKVEINKGRKYKVRKNGHLVHEWFKENQLNKAGSFHTKTSINFTIKGGNLWED